MALTLTTNKFLHQEVMVAHRLLRLEQAKQIRQMIPLPLKQITGPREGLLPHQLQPETGAKQEL